MKKLFTLLPLRTATPADCTINLRDSFLFAEDEMESKDSFWYYFEEPARFLVYVKQGSALNLYHILDSLDRFAGLYEDSDAKHGLDFLANYGFAVYNKDTIVKYIVQRSAVFFQTIMVWQQSNPASFPPFGYRGGSCFKDCKNNRICTDTTSNNSCP